MTPVLPSQSHLSHLSTSPPVPIHLQPLKKHQQLYTAHASLHPYFPQQSRWIPQLWAVSSTIKRLGLRCPSFLNFLVLIPLPSKTWSWIWSMLRLSISSFVFFRNICKWVGPFFFAVLGLLFGLRGPIFATPWIRGRLLGPAWPARTHSLIMRWFLSVLCRVWPWSVITSCSSSRRFGCLRFSIILPLPWSFYQLTAWFLRPCLL